jgi:hypothetical protein
LNNFEIVVFLQILENTIQFTDISINLSSKESEPAGPVNLPENKNNIPEQVILQEQPATDWYNLQKYNRSQKAELDKPDKPDDRVAKQTRAILALLEQEEFDLDNQETVFAVSTKDQEIIQIPISKSYSSTVKNLIYRPE